MVKSVAEISRDYRNRKKSGDGAAEWKAKESGRVLKYYTPISMVTSRKEVDLRRERNRQAQARWREKKKQEKQEKQEKQASQSEPGTSGLQVKINFKTPKQARTRKRTSHAVAKANAVISKLEVGKKKSTRRIWKLEKRLQRARNKIRELMRPKRDPKALAEKDLNKAGLTTEAHPRLYQKLVAHHALLLTVKSGLKKNKTKTKKKIISVLSGRISKKYRILRYLGRETGINRNQLGGCKKNKKKHRLPAYREALRKRVISFMERDDISRMLPGKRDSVRIQKGERQQARVLSDYLSNLWMKFQTENPDCKISLAVFCRIRPAHIKLTAFASRRSCLCIYHQNLVLKLRAAHVSTSPDCLIKEKTDDQILQLCLSDSSEVTFYCWEKVKTDSERTHTKCIQKTVTSDEFKQALQEDLPKFRAHVGRIECQYRAIKVLKETLQPNEIIICMDFSENYSCRDINEIQSAYWAQTQVTIHPVIFYLRNEDMELVHESHVYISSILAHSPSTVFAIMKDINEQIDLHHPSVDTLHYITDSPTSQYRNKVTFHAIGNHGFFFLRSATWSFHEVGHGKGPCDGIGGLVKRLADEAVRRGTVVINGATDFFNWLKNDSSCKVTAHMLHEAQYEEANQLVTNMDAKAVKGTMLVHGVMSPQPGKLALRETSCFCRGCKRHLFCDGWSITEVKAEEEKIILEKDEWVAAVYHGEAYYGRIQKVSSGEAARCQISFLWATDATKTTYKWPRTKDVLWISESNILCNIHLKMSSSRPQHVYTLPRSMAKRVRYLMSQRKS